MTRHAERRTPGGKPRGGADKKARKREDWLEEEDFPVLDGDLLLLEPEAPARQRRGRRQGREDVPPESVRPAAGEAQARERSGSSPGSFRERAERGRGGRGKPPYEGERRAGEAREERPRSDGRRQENGRNTAHDREASSRRQDRFSETRPADGARREGRRPVPRNVPDRERWSLLSALLPGPDAALRDGLDMLGAALARVRPLAPAHARSLPQDVAELSRLLTVERAHLHQPYWASPALTSAYLYYFLPWNVLRQARLLSALPLPDPRIWVEQGRRPLLLDMGSGPLSLPIALWLARPQWRGLPLTVLALDASSQPLELGRDLLRALADELRQPSWEVRTVRAPLGQAARQLSRASGSRSRTAADGDAPALWLASAANVLNEMLSGGGAGRTGRRDGAASWEPDDDAAMPGESREDSLFGQRLESVLDSLEEVLEGGDPSLPASLLVVEPGTRLGGTTVMRLRGAALERGLVPLAPCTHGADCPLERGRSGRGWCHMTFDCAGVPDWLAQLSDAAGLAKDSLSLAPLLLSTAAETVQDGLDAREAETAGDDGVLSRAALRVLSAPFAVPGLPGRARYACGVGGLALLGDAESLPSGGLVEADIPEQPRFDRRSGALLLLPEGETFAKDAPARAPRPSEKPAGRQERSPRGSGDGKRFSQDNPDKPIPRKGREGRPSPPSRQTPHAPRNERQEHGRRPDRDAPGRPPRRKPS